MDFVNRVYHYILHEHMYCGPEDDENVTAVREFKTFMVESYQITDYRNIFEAHAILNMFRHLTGGVNRLGLTEDVAWSIIGACSASQRDKAKQAQFRNHFYINFYIRKVLRNIVRDMD